MITRFDIAAARLQIKLLRSLGEPVPADAESLANHPLPAGEPAEITQFHINAARLQRKLLLQLGETVPEEINQIANMADFE